MPRGCNARDKGRQATARRPCVPLAVLFSKQLALLLVPAVRLPLLQVLHREENPRPQGDAWQERRAEDGRTHGAGEKAPEAIIRF